MRIELDRRVRDQLARELAAHLRGEFDLEIGGMDAVLLLDFIADQIGPHFYNQALYDAHALLHVKLDALGEALTELEKPAKG